eukprot:g6997.t1
MCERCKCDSCVEKRKNLIIVEKNDDIVINFQIDNFTQKKLDYPNTAYLFSPADKKGCCLKIYPCGISIPDKLSIYLNCGIIKDEINGLPFSVNITNDDNTSLVSQSNLLDYGDTSLFGWKSLINNALLPDSFKISLTVSRTKKVAKPNFALALNNRFIKLLHTEQHADVVFKVLGDDGDKPVLINAHRLVLASISPVFGKMFSDGPWKDTKNKPIIIDSVQPHVFKIFLEILYGKQLEFDENFAPIAMHLIALSSKYSVKELGDSIVECIEYNLTSDIAIDALRCADRFELEYVDFKPCVLKFIKNNLRNVLLSDGYRDLLSDNANMKLVSDITLEMAGIKHSEIEVSGSANITTKTPSCGSKRRRDSP